jgi:hypothetical protein
VAIIAIGGFVSISRMRILSGNIQESQQKIRISQEMIARLARQAGFARATNSNKTLELYFFQIPGSPKGYRFDIYQPSGSPASDYKLRKSECAGIVVTPPETPNCTTDFTHPVGWDITNAADLLGGKVVLNNTSNFLIQSLGAYPELNINLYGDIRGSNSPFSVNASALLEGIQ